MLLLLALGVKAEDNKTGYTTQLAATPPAHTAVSYTQQASQVASLALHSSPSQSLALYDAPTFHKRFAWAPRAATHLA